MTGDKWQKVGIWEIEPTEERNFGCWTWGDDANVVMLETLTPDTNDVEELKVQIKELKVAMGRLSYEKDIIQRNVLKKVEELMEEVKALRWEVKEIEEDGFFLEECVEQEENEDEEEEK